MPASPEPAAAMGSVGVASFPKAKGLAGFPLPPASFEIDHARIWTPHGAFVR